MKSLQLIFLALLLIYSSCQPDQGTNIQSPKVANATAKDFEEAKQVSATIADGLEMELWAPGPLLSNAVALTFDNQGIAYVSETQRRKSSDIDIRQHPDWMIEDIGLQTIEDTRDFHLKKLAPNLSEQNTWQEDFNEDGIHDYRDLAVQSEYIRRVWDSDGDGKADKSQLYAEGFNSMLTGVAAGILNYDDEVFLTAAPDVYRLKDTNKDGLADDRSIISHGYGIHIAFAGHDMSGLTMGPDGRIYWSIGDIGVNVVDANGKRWAYPNQGAIMRSNPDGSDFEVYAHGVRNPQEIAFDALGNLISVDNDGDHRGEHERYIHIVEGSDTGWRINWQFGKYNNPNEAYKVWMDEKLYVPHFEGQAAYLLPPLALAYNGPAGFAYNPGTALGKEWEDYFFASYFTASSAKSKIQAFKIKPKGASFEITDEKEVVSGIVPTGITFAADGALYINDWKDSYDKKPEGRIWQLKAKHAHPLQKETQELLKEGLGNKSVAELSELIAYPDQRVRMAAQFALVKQKEATTLLTLAEKNPNLLGRIHAIWGIGQLARKEMKEATPLSSFLKDTNEHIRAQTAKVIGDAKYAPAFNKLVDLLKQDSPKVQFFAAEALGKIGDKNAFQALVDLLEKIEETDPHLRHAIMYALSKLNQANALAELANHSSKYVRIGAVVVLRMMQSPNVAAFLNDKEELVLVEAARAINDDFSIPAALPALAKALDRKGIKNEAFIRRAINANLRGASAENAQRLADYASSKEVAESMRTDALWALGYWSKPPLLDRVDNRYRELKGHKMVDAQKAMASIFPKLLMEKPTLKAAVIAAAGRTNYKEASQKIYTIFNNKQTSSAVRITALNALANLKSTDLNEAINIALVDKNVGLRKEAQTLLENVNLPTPTLVAMFEKILNNNTIPEQQKALASLAKIKYKSAADLLKKWLDKLINKNLQPALQLDVLTAIENSSFEDLKDAKGDYESTFADKDLLTQYEFALSGGDKTKGQRIFSRNTTAQCLRCHAIQGYGGAVGPAMDGIANKLSPTDLLLSLVDPNARIAPGYGTVILKLKDNQELAGILMEETTDKLQIKVGGIPVQTITKKDISERENLPSGMFDMSEILSKTEIRDLMAFLVDLKK